LHQSTLHHPHPNIVDELRGTIASDTPAATAAGVVVANSNGGGIEAVADEAEINSDDDDETTPISLNDISEQFQIPKHVYEQHQLKL